jgi:hypothetical protein
MSAAAWGLLLVGLVVAAVAWRAIRRLARSARRRRTLLAAMSPATRARAPQCATEPRTFAALAVRRSASSATKQLGIAPLNWD